MDSKKYLSSNIVSIDDILNLRDNRQQFINKLIKEYRKTIIVFSMNIVGPIKVFNLSKKAFIEGNSLILRMIEDHKLHLIYHHKNEQLSGYESYYVIDYNPIELKKLVTNIEDSTDLGRLFDIDVITNEGVKVSRSNINIQGRKCILCDTPVFICSRSRKHSVDDLIEKEIEIMFDYFSNKMSDNISSIAVESLILEVKTTPKPGLVDLNNNGSHKDLNIELFIKSANILKPFFKNFFLLGVNCDKEIDNLFISLRKCGLNAEKAMYKETNGVNTHKGAIFIFSLLLASLGYIFSNSIYSRKILINKIINLSKDINNDFNNINKKNLLTNGERIFLELGIKGVRGEALSGFDKVIKNTVDKLTNYCKEGYSLNDSGAFTLLDILLNINDTNIISRSNYETLLFYKEKIKNNIELTGKEKISFIQELDKEFIDNNISAGGSADLLALTYFIYLFESKFEKNFTLINS